MESTMPRDNTGTLLSVCRDASANEGRCIPPRMDDGMVGIDEQMWMPSYAASGRGLYLRAPKGLKGRSDSSRRSSDPNMAREATP